MIPNNHRVCITGASSGIGEEFARQFHKAGCRLLLVARRRDRLESLASELEAIRPDSADVLVADLAKESGDRSLETLVQVLEESHIDILVNNAGRGSFGEFDELHREDELAMIRLNVLATTALAHAVLQQMKARGSGALITTSSVAAFQPLPYMATYAATKAFNYYHSMALHYEYARHGICVLAVCPGPTATEFGGVARVPGTVAGVGRDDVEAVVAESLQALRRKKAFLVPCLRSRLLSYVCRVLPTTLTTRLTRRALFPALEASKKAASESGEA